MEKDDGYSSGDADHSLRSSVILNSANLTFGDDPNAYKKDKSCTGCLKSFSIMGSMKKHFCKFCFRGVCESCSKHTAPDQRGKNVRICDNCYKRAIQDQIRDSLQKELDSANKELEEIKKNFAVEQEQKKIENFRKETLEKKLNELKLGNERKEKELNDNAEKMKKEIKMMEEDIQELTKILSTAGTEKQQKEDKIANLKQEIIFLNTETQGDIDKINDLKKLIEEQEKENEDLTKELDSHNETPSEIEDPLSRASLIDTLKNKFSQAKDQNKELKKENESLKKKVIHLREENNNKKTEANKLEETLGKKRPASKIANDIKDLEDQIAYQDQEIIRLQERLNVISTPK